MTKFEELVVRGSSLITLLRDKKNGEPYADELPRLEKDVLDFHRTIVAYSQTKVIDRSEYNMAMTQYDVCLRYLFELKNKE